MKTEMSEAAKDPAIKLFGMTIPVPEIHAGAPPSPSGDIVDDDDDDAVDHNLPSPTNSSRESHTKKDEDEHETEKVWKVLIFTVTLYLKR